MPMLSPAPPGLLTQVRLRGGAQHSALTSPLGVPVLTSLRTTALLKDPGRLKMRVRGSGVEVACSGNSPGGSSCGGRLVPRRPACLPAPPPPTGAFAWPSLCGKKCAPRASLWSGEDSHCVACITPDSKTLST